MTKKVKVSLLILVWSIVAIQIYVNGWEKKRQTADIVTAFSVVGEEEAEMRINGYGYLGSMHLTREQKEQMLVNLAKRIGYDGETTIRYPEGTEGERAELQVPVESGIWTIRIVGIQEEDAKSTGDKENELSREKLDNSSPEELEQYIGMQFVSGGEIRESMEEYQQMEQLYESLGMKAQVTIEVSLAREGNLVKKDAGGLVNKLLQDLDATKVDKIWRDDVYTIYGYTKQIDTYYVLNGKKVNLQLAFIYDEEKDRTTIKMGIPLLESSY